MIVVDTNVIAALVLESPQTETALAVWERDSVWFAPPIWESELRNVLIQMMRQGLFGLETAGLAFRHASEFVETMPVGTGAVFRFCEEYPLTAYDAEFAALAEYLGGDLVSFDDDLTGNGLALTPEAFLKRS